MTVALRSLLQASPLPSHQNHFKAKPDRNSHGRAQPPSPSAPSLRVARRLPNLFFFSRAVRRNPSVWLTAPSLFVSEDPGLALLRPKAGYQRGGMLLLLLCRLPAPSATAGPPWGPFPAASLPRSSFPCIAQHPLSQERALKCARKRAQKGTLKRALNLCTKARTAFPTGILRHFKTI